MRGKLVSVWGPTGAPGRTSVAVGVATELALSGRSVALVDLDVYGASIAAYLELFDESPGFLSLARIIEARANEAQPAPFSSVKVGSFEVEKGQGELDDPDVERVAHICSLGKARFTVFTGVVNPARWPELSTARVREALAYLARRYDTVVLDLGFNLEQDEEIASDLLSPRRNQATVTALRNSDVVIAVGGADVVGMARYIHALEALRVIAEEADLVYVINRIRRTGALSNAASTVRSTLKRFANLSDVYLLDEDTAAFDAANISGVPLCVSAPRSAVRKQYQELACRIDAVLGEEHVLNEQVAAMI